MIVKICKTLLIFAMVSGSVFTAEVYAKKPIVNPRVQVPTPSESLPVERAAATVGGTWVSKGPAPLQGEGTENITNGEASGAAHTLVPHPTNADILWVAGANGGVWKTTNATAASPSWTPLTDTQTSLSIGAMELDPTDTDHNTLVACFGRPSAFGNEGGLLNGLLRSTDGGTTWTLLTAAVLENENCSGVAARGATIVMSANAIDGQFGNGGIYRSTDTGATWAKIDGGLPFGSVFDLVGDPASSSRLYASSQGQGIYRSDDTGATWSAISSQAQTTIFSAVDTNQFPVNNNSEMTIAPNGRLYIAIIHTGQAVAVEYTDNPTDASPTWVSMDLPTTPIPEGTTLTVTDATNASPIVITTSAAHGLKSGNFVQIKDVVGNTAANGVYNIIVLSDTTFELRLTTGNAAYESGGSAFKVNGANPKFRRGAQGGIHFSLLADKNNSNIVYLGGDAGDLPSFIGATNFTGSLWRGDTTVAATSSSPSPQWAHITHSNSIEAIPTGGTASSSAPHADSREMFQDATGAILQTDDGGIYRRSTPTSNTGDWTSVNGNLSMFEQHNIAYDTISNIVISGNQDNGTSIQNSTGSTVWKEIFGGDGGDVAVDTTTATPNSIRYFSSQNNGGFSRATYDTSNVQTDITEPALEGSSGWQPNFVTPIELNPTNQARFVLGGQNGILETANKGDSVTFLQTDAINEGGLAYGAADNADVLYAASGSTVLSRVSGAGAPTATAAAFPGNGITDLLINPSTANTLYVSDATSVYITTDAGATWTNITGNLAESNALLRTLEFIPGDSPSIVVGGNRGVSIMKLSEQGTWNTLGSGIPNALVYDLDFDATDNILVAGTLGRGTWTLENVVDTAGSRLVNIATRAGVGTVNNVMIGGLIIAGDSPKEVVIRARGPSLIDADPNLTGLLEDPFLQLFSGATLIDSNDNWESHERAASIRQDLKPNRASEAAISTTLDPGAYTAIVRGVGETTGVGIVEIFEVSDTGTTRLINIATRGFVGSPPDVLIGGLIITGTANKTVTIRARGPSLVDADPNLTGLLEDPFIQLFSGATLIDSNDNWESHESANSLRTDLRPSRASEAVITKSLAPGAYTAVVQGVGNTSGIAIVEVFEID